MRRNCKTERVRRPVSNREYCARSAFRQPAGLLVDSRLNANVASTRAIRTGDALRIVLDLAGGTVRGFDPAVLTNSDELAPGDFRVENGVTAAELVVIASVSAG